MRREAAGYTRRALGDLAGVSERSIAAYESGETVPRVDALHRLSESLGCTLDDLARDEVAA